MTRRPVDLDRLPLRWVGATLDALDDREAHDLDESTDLDEWGDGAPVRVIDLDDPRDVAYLLDLARGLDE